MYPDPHGGYGFIMGVGVGMTTDTLGYTYADAYLQHISICPTCITKTQSLIFQENENIHNYFEREEGKVQCPTEARGATEEGKQYYYA